MDNTSDHRSEDSKNTWFFLGKWKLKPKWNAATYLLEWLDFVNWQCQVLERTWSHWTSCTLLVGMQNVTATQENSLAVSYTVKHLPYNLTISLPVVFARDKGKFLSTEHPVCNYLVALLALLKLPQTGNNPNILKQTVVHLYSGLSNKKERITTTHNMVHLKCTVLGEKKKSKGYLL